MPEARAQIYDVLNRREQGERDRRRYQPRVHSAFRGPDPRMEAAIDRYGARNIAPLVYSIFEQESGGGAADTSRANGAGARGPMQVTRATFEDLQRAGAIPADYRHDDPEHTTEAGVALLRRLNEQYGGDAERVARAYYGGPQGVDEERFDPRNPNAPSTFEYGREVADRAQRFAGEMGEQAPAEPVMTWEEAVAAPEYEQARASGQEEAYREAYWNEVVAPTIPAAQRAAARAAFDEDTAPGLMNAARREGRQLKTDFVRGAKHLFAGITAAGAGATARRVQQLEKEVAWLESQGQGDSVLAGMRKAELERAREQLPADIAKTVSREQAAAAYAQANPPRPGAEAVANAPTFDAAWQAFKAHPYDAIAGITAESAAMMAPGLVAGLLGGPLAAAVGMGASSFIGEYGSSFSDFARDHGIDLSNAEQLQAFFSDPERLREAMAYAGKRASIIGAFDAATTGIASKTLAPTAIKSTLGRQAVNVPTQVVVQGAGGAAGEAGGQLATEGRITEPGQVAAEAIGELGGAPAEVAALARHAIRGESEAPAADPNSLRARTEALRARTAQARAGVQPPVAAEDVLGAAPATPHTEARAQTEAAVGAPPPPAGGEPAPAALVAAERLLAAVEKGGIPLNPAILRQRAEDLGLEVSSAESSEAIIQRIANAVQREKARLSGAPADAEPARVYPFTDSAGRRYRLFESGGRTDEGETTESTGSDMRVFPPTDRAPPTSDDRPDDGEPPPPPGPPPVAPEQPQTNVAAAVDTPIDAAAHEAATSPTNGKAEPTEAQKEAGNYAKGHVRVQGLDISIENPRGSERRGKSKDGKEWSVTMPGHYGYIRGTVGKDKDHIDITLGPDPENASLPIFVFNQANENGRFDEHKVFMGYTDAAAARAAYRDSFSGKLGQRMENNLLGVARFTPQQFKDWLADGDHNKPVQARPAPPAKDSPLRRFPQFADDPQTAERLATGVIADELRRMATQAGWDERGGRMIRKSEDPDSPDYSTVVGRTKWLPREPWFQDLSPKLNKGGDYTEVVERALAGGELSANERRVVASMAEIASERMFDEDPETAVMAQVSASRRPPGEGATRAEQEEYLAYLDEQERAENEWFEREAASARGEAGEPARGAGQPDRLPEQAPAEETSGSDPGREGVGQGADRGTPEAAAPRVARRSAERPVSQDRLEFIAGGKKGLEAHILFGRFADGRWGAVSGYQFRTGTMLGRTGPLDDRVPSMADTREEAINGAATILHNWMRGIASNQQADHTPAMREAATALADRLAKQYEIAAPPDAAPSPPTGKAPERDLFGEAPVSKQALADEQRRRDEKRNSGQDSTETGDPSDLFSQARQQTDLTETAAPKAAPRPSKNTIFTEDAAEAARAVLRKKLGQINAGIDPELLNAGITLAGYHIEKGARTFAAFAEAMIADLGEAVRPFLKSWYMAVKYDPRAKPFEKQMDSAGDVEAFDLHEDANLSSPAETATEPGASEADDAAEAAAVGAAMDALVARLRGEGFKSIVEARKFLSELTGQPITDADLKYVDESIETAVVAAARDIAGEGNDPARTFADLVDLYRKQPKLGTRTSTSVAQQAYSTPAPLAFLASRLAGVTSETSVYEPSAGNGMLLIEASPRNTHAVELNPDRAAALQAMGFNPVVGDAMSDATAPDHKQDVVIANPPFGVVRTDSGATRGFTVDVGGDFPTMQTNEIDHAISLHALSYLKDDGRAVLIIGGINKLARTEEARSDAYNGAAKRKFFYHLYRLYNVVDHFTVAGELYERQGAGWPVDVIVIHGRGKSSRALPAADVPRVYSDWAAMAPLLESGDGQASGLGADAEGSGRVPLGGPVRPKAGTGSRSVPEPARGSDSGAGERLSRPAGSDRAAATAPVGSRPVPGRGERAAGVGGQPTGLEQSGDSRTAGSARRAASSGSEASGTASGAPADRGGSVRPDGSARGVGRPDGKAPVASEGQSPYEPTSSADSVGTLVPSNMRTAIADSLSALVGRVGPLDQYVARELGYAPSRIGEFFSGEQVDALALALDQMQRGAGFIIGDQTGVGKGRVVAGVIRYALKNGRTPIFVTEKPNLYADMYRDLTDIGMQDIRPLMTNAGEKVPLDDDGKVVLKTPAGKAHSQALEEMASTGDLGAHNIVFTTYSQMQTLKGAETSRMAFLRAIAPNAIVIFDESHNAGGNDSARKNQRQMEVDAGSKKTGRAAFARALAGLANGVFYSSATYAKRPSVMDLYFKTDMRMAVGGNVEALPDAIQAGGVPLQQVVASMLARAGQYIRRERSFEGVEYNTAETTVDRPAAERISAIMLSVKEFDDAKKEAVKALAQAAKREAKQITGDGATGAAGAESTNFTSIMHNAIDQMLLGLKAERAAELAIEALKRGEKPVITVANTMGSFIEEYAEAAGMKSGDAINLTFGDLLARYLERSRDVRIKSPDGTSSRHRMSDEELGPFALSAYRAAEELVRSAGEIASMPVSPIDWIHARIQAAGYTSGEITGRTHTIDYGSAGGRPIYRSRGSKATSIFGRRKTITDFNSGKLDVVVLNQAGATGLSLHASEKFKDKRRRRMIIAQAEKNIDTHMQMLGRVHRTGQVVAPAYDQLVADVPAEKRPAAVLAKKMASLNANTTASRTSAVTSKDTVDFLNQYGDEVVAQLMADLPDVHRRLGEPLDNDSEGYVTEDAARKVTGRIPLLPVAEQEELYDMIESGYREAIARADAMGENALEAKTLELDAKTIERRTLFEREGDSNSPFADAAYLETVDAKRLGKPYTSEQVRELAAGEAGLGKDAAWDDIKDAAAEKWRRTASDTRDSFQQYRAGLEKAMFDAGTKDVVARARLGVLDGQFDRWKGLADTLTPGETYELQLKNGAVFYGVLLDITRKKGVKMPVANGSWVARFAVADGARQIALPFSKLTTSREDAARPEARVTYVEARAEHPLLGSILKMFDAGQSTSRENRHIVTGNLLAGFSKLPRGQIVHYTDDTGATRQGVLLPRNFDIKEFEAAQPIELAPAAAMKLLKSHPQARVETADGSVRLLADGDGFLLSTPRSKSGGGDVYLDPQVRAITGDFVSVANSMRAGITAEQARRVLPILAEKFGPLQAESHRKEALAAGGRRAIGNVVPPDSTGTTEVRENAAVYEGEAAKDPKVRARRRKVANRPAEAGRGDVQPAAPVQIDIFANAAGPGPGEQVARAFDRVALVETGRFKTGITTIDEWTAAAHIIAPLRKIPQEQFLMLAIDKRRRPMAVLRHTIGLRDSANVDPGTVFGQIASLPNVAKVYFAHNHPSGSIEQSEADHFITDRLSALFRGSGIEVGGMIVVAPGSRKASLYTPGTYGDLDQRIQPAVRKESVPMLERRFTRIQPDKFIVRSSAYVKEAIERFASRMESGLLFLNGRHHVVGVLPTSVAEMGRLRTDDPRTSHARLFAEASKANASAAIAVVPEGEESVNAARNAMTALAAGNIRDLDIAQRGANGSLRMASDRSERITNDAFYSRAGATPAAGASVTQVKEWLSAAIEKTRGAANTHVVADVAALREATGDPNIPDDTEGVYYAGGRDIYLVADRLPTRDVAQRKFAHEMLGHLAPELYGDLNRAVRAVLAARDGGRVRALWQEVTATQPGLKPQEHAKEVVALVAERGIGVPWMADLIARARDLLRKFGFDLEFSDADIRGMIARAARALHRDSTGREASAAARFGVRGAPAYSREDNLAFVARVLRQLGTVDDLFKNDAGVPTSLRDVFKGIPGFMVPQNDTDPSERSGVQRNVTHFTRQIEGGGTDRVPVYIYQRGREVWINVSQLRRGEGGDRIYQGIADYARATGRRFIGDPAGLSPDASVRRTYHMLSNLLRYGDLAGFEPAREQLEGNAKAGIPPLAWPADNEGRLRSLIKTFYGTLRADFPEITNYGYDFRTGTYTDRRGKRLPEDALKHLLAVRGRAIPYRRRAVRAGIFLQSLARLESEARPGVLAEVLRQPERVVQRSKALFSRGVAPQAAAPRELDHSGLVDAALKHFGGKQFAKLITGPLYDRLIHIGGQIVPEKLKQGLVADYGLPEPYLDAKIDRQTAINRTLRKTRNLLDSIAGLDREQSRIAYLWMNEKPDTDLERDLMARLPEDARAAVTHMKELVDELGRDAVSVGLLSQDSYERNRMAYLHRSYKKHLQVGDSQRASANHRKAARVRADNYKGRGLRDNVSREALPESLEKGDLVDRYERRDANGRLRAVRYVAQGEVPDGPWTLDGTWEARWWPASGGSAPVGLWRDLKPDERERLGEIEEVRYAFARTMLNAAHDIESQRFLAWVGDHYAVDEGEVDPDHLVEAGTGYLSTNLYGADDYVRVPTVAIGKTPGLTKYGALSGKVIPAVMWNDIRVAFDLPQSDVARIYAKALRAWKVSKTALSPTVHTNNVMSNFILADIADVRARDVARALATIYRSRKGDAAAADLVARFEDAGGEAGSFHAMELNESIVRPLLAELQGEQDEGVYGQLSAAQIVSLLTAGRLSEAARAIGRKAGPKQVIQAGRKMIDVYRSEDSVFRLAKFIREVEAGQSDREAGKRARDAFLNYDINAPLVQAARHTVLPFIAFSYRAIPKMIEAAAKKPWKIAKYFMAGTLLNAMAYSMLGLGDDDEDKERKLLPEEMQGRLLGVFPRLVRLPWNSDNGAPMFLDVRRWVPAGDMFDVTGSHGAIPLVGWLSVGGPLALFMELNTNKSAFTGQEIYRETDTAGEKVEKVFDHIFKFAVPNLPLPNPLNFVLPAGKEGNEPKFIDLGPPGLDRDKLQTYAWTGVLNAGTGRTDPFGREQSSVPMSLLSSMGVKVRSYPQDVAASRAKMDMDQALREIGANIARYKREYARGGLTRAELERLIAREQAKQRAAAEQAREKITAQ